VIVTPPWLFTFIPPINSAAPADVALPDVAGEILLEAVLFELPVSARLLPQEPVNSWVAINRYEPLTAPPTCIVSEPPAVTIADQMPTQANPASEVST